MLRLSTASAAALIGASTVLAGEVTFKVTGFLDGALFSTRQSTTGFANPDQEGLDGGYFGKLNLRGSMITEGGTEFGAHVQLRLKDTSPDALGVEKAYIWAENGLGRLEIGAEDGAAKLAYAAPPSLTRSVRLDDQKIATVHNGAGKAYLPGRLVLRSDSNASDQSLKIVYRSPRLVGFQLNLSYTPEFSANMGSYVKTAATDFDQQSRIFEAGLNYESTFDNLKLKASLTYLMAENEAERDTTITAISPWKSGNLTEWSAAAGISVDGFSIGAAYRHSNAQGGSVDHAPVVLTGGASDTSIWSLGALYEVGDWRFGANYIHGKTNVAIEALPAGRIETQSGNAFQIAAGYAFTKELQLSAGFQRYSFDASSGINPLARADARPLGMIRSTYVGDLSADVIFTELSYEF